MPWARASALDRAIACPASCVLPKVVDTFTSDAARWGNIVHEWAETGRWPKLRTREFTRRQAALDAVDVTRQTLWPSDDCHEVSFALHTANRIVARFDSKVKAEREAWKASFDAGWVTGTADYFDPEGFLGGPWVDDLKTGREVPDDPWDLWQLRFHAVCAAMITGAQGVTVSVTHWPRYPADDPPRPRAYRTVTRGELLDLVLPLLETARRAAAPGAEPTPGTHCRWCPARAACPLDPALTLGYHITTTNTHEGPSTE